MTARLPVEPALLEPNYPPTPPSVDKWHARGRRSVAPGSHRSAPLELRCRAVGTVTEGYEKVTLRGPSNTPPRARAWRGRGSRAHFAVAPIVLLAASECPSRSLVCSSSRSSPQAGAASRGSISLAGQVTLHANDRFGDPGAWPASCWRSASRRSACGRRARKRGARRCRPSPRTPAERGQVYSSGTPRYPRSRSGRRI